jgi:hypothetical protein
LREFHIGYLMLFDPAETESGSNVFNLYRVSLNPMLMIYLKLSNDLFCISRFTCDFRKKLVFKRPRAFIKINHVAHGLCARHASFLSLLKPLLSKHLINQSVLTIGCVIDISNLKSNFQSLAGMKFVR